jgi:hypothetical protein
MNKRKKEYINLLVKMTGIGLVVPDRGSVRQNIQIGMKKNEIIRGLVSKILLKLLYELLREAVV